MEGKLYKLILVCRVMKRMNKIGAGHVEFILSTILFIGVVAFVLILYNPVGGERTISSSLDYVFTEIIKNTQVDVDSYSVKINEIILNDKIRVQISDTVGKVSRVKDKNGVVKPSVAISSGVDLNPDGTDYVSIILAKDIIPSVSPLGNLVEDISKYEIISSDSRKIVSENEIERLIGEYEAEGGYEDLKERFNLPGADFSFSLVFTNPDGTHEEINSGENVPEGLDVFSGEKRIEVLRKSGEIKFADLIVRVW